MFLEALRAQTVLFIQYQPKSIVLTPVTRTTTNQGGQSVGDGTPRAAQDFRVIALTANQRPTITVSGKERFVDYHLLGAHDSVMEVGDYWWEDGDRYEIIAIQPGHDYEKKALVEQHRPGDV